MSISGALSNALSGLTANARSAQVTASNLSNALTPGYGRRAVELATRGIGSHGGVRVVGVNRLVDQATISDRRFASASQANAQAKSDFFARLEGLTGLPGEAGSLSTRLSSFDESLVAAASRPDLSERLDAAGHHAEKLTEKFHTISNTLQGMRAEADAKIAQMIQRLNASLAAIEDLNTHISRIYNTPEDILTLQDERQLLIDQVAEIVPVRVISRDRGVVGLYTDGGAILLDGPAPELTFNKTPTIEAHMTLASGDLSGVSINGKSIDISSDNGPLSGGALAGQILIRDELAPEAQSKLDGLARELAERFQDPSLDTTILATDPALFADIGGRFNAANETGFAGRIQVNALVSSTGSHETWRLRDGLGAVTAGNVGNASLLNRTRSALTASQTAAAASLNSASGGLGDFVDSVLSDQSLKKSIADNELGYRSSQFSAFLEKERAFGVDSDQELQTMMIVEQSYAANARMIQTVDELIQTLLRL